MTAPLEVLLIEDEALNRALIRAILARQVPGGSIVLHEAPTIREGRRILAARPVDVILLDVRLPDGSGLELARELRDAHADRAPDDAAGASAPLIAILSASVLHEERLAAETSGADAFLGKPFVPHELVDLLDRFRGELDQRRAVG